MKNYPVHFTKSSKMSKLLEPTFCEQVLPIPRIRWDEFWSFIEKNGEMPCLITDAVEKIKHIPLTRFRQLVTKGIEENTTGLVEGFAEYGSKERIQLSFDKFFDDFENGTSTLNVVDQYLVSPELDQLMPIPSLFEEKDLLSKSYSRRYLRGMVASSKGCYSVTHVDGYGYGGSMLLFEGRKIWEFISQEEGREKLFKPETMQFADPRIDSLEKYKVKVGYQGEIKGGELIYSPSGWLHRVSTPERSYGYASAYVFPHTLPIVEDVCKFESTRQNVDSTEAYKKRIALTLDWIEKQKALLVH